MLASILGTRVQGFAGELAASIAKRYPPTLDLNIEKRPSVNRLTRIMEETCAKAVEYQIQHRLSWFAKARLGNAFRWELAERGYSKDFVELATEALVVSLAKSRVGKTSDAPVNDGARKQ